ncbi:MAG: aminotransferase class V-fold PLP-dependent enzyme [Rhodothermales bacterium]|nr:aminotransferase class V-fold PLP-dependent enzyme [Rhodothermales bacterium]
MNIDRLRAETPGCAHVTHFNNAGAALMPQPVLDAQLRHLELEARIGGYEAAAHAKGALEDTHRAVADMLGASSEEIAFVDNATRAWGAVFFGMDFKPGDRILTARASYASNFIGMLQRARKMDLHIDVAPDDEHGQVDVDALEKLIDSRTRIICLTHIPTNGGLVNPAAEVGKVARKHGIPFLLDACQSAGQMPLNVDELGCDALSATGRKFIRGPRGTGFLYVRQPFIDQLEPPFLDLHAADWTTPDSYRLHADHRRFETWEINFAGKIGLGVAVRYAQDIGLAAIRSRVDGLAGTLRSALREIPDITVHDSGLVKSGTVTFSHRKRDATEIKSALLAQGINTSVAVPSGALLDALNRGLPDMVRASVHYYNTVEEIEALVEALSDLQTS